MVRKIKKILSVVTAAAMLMTMMPVTSLATDENGALGSDPATLDGVTEVLIDRNSQGLYNIINSSNIIIKGITLAEDPDNGLNPVGNTPEWDKMNQSSSSEELARANHDAKSSGMDVIPAERMAFKFTGEGDLTLHLENVAISLTNSVKTESGTYSYLDMFDFDGYENITVYLNGTNLLDMDTNASYRCIFHVVEGQTIRFLDEYPDNPAVNYFYSREQGAGIGGHGNASDSNKGNGEIHFGDDGNYGPILFMKNSKQGAGIGNGANTSAQPGNIYFHSGIYNFIAVSRAAMISGSAGTGSQSAGNVFIDKDVCMRINVDFTGAAIGGGGYASGNDKGGGNCYFNGGSVAVFEDYNSSSNNADGSGMMGYSDTMITATKLNGNEDEHEMTYSCILDTTNAPAGESVELLIPHDVLDDEMGCGYRTVTDESLTLEYMDVQVDGEDFYHGPMHNYFYVNETLYKTNQHAITTTFSNWKLLSQQETPEANPYLYFFMTGEDHTVTINGQEFELTFNHGTKFYRANGTSTPITCDTEDGAIFNDENVENSQYDRWIEASFTMTVPETTVTGGQTISEGGNYPLSDETEGTITINAEDAVVLNGSGETYDNLTLDIQGAGTVTLKNVNLTGTGTLLNVEADATVKLAGNSSLTSTGGDAVTVAAGKTLTVDSAADPAGVIHQRDGVLAVTAGVDHAAIKVESTGIYDQIGGTVKAVKTGAANTENKAAVYADGATVKFRGGEFAGTTSAADSPAIKAETFQTGKYSTVYAAAPQYTYAVEAAAYTLGGGSLEAVSSGVSASSENGVPALSGLTGYGMWRVDTSTLAHAGTTFSVWEGDSTNPENICYYGAGHWFDADADGDALVATPEREVNKTSGNQGEVTMQPACDQYLYLWFTVDNDDTTHSLTVNDDYIGSKKITEDGTGGTTSTTYTISVESGMEDFITVDKTSATKDETITATLNFPANVYTLNTQGFRYKWNLGSSVSSSTLGSEAGTVTFKMPAHDITVCAELELKKAGDVSLDGKLSAGDAGVLLLAGANALTPEGFRLTAANQITGEGYAAKAAHLLRYLVGLDNTL